MAVASILVVDDEFHIRRVLSTLLEDAGYNVELADSGDKAVEILKSQHIDLVILDIKIPGMDGREVLSKIREHKKLQDVPVIILTAYSDIETVVEFLELGANDYISKPFNESELLARVKTQLRAAEATRLRTLMQFAGAMAHEINQPLSVIKGQLQLCKLKAKDGSAHYDKEFKDLIDLLLNNVDRIEHIVKKIEHIHTYRLKEYVGGVEIIELE